MPTGRTRKRNVLSPSVLATAIVTAHPRERFDAAEARLRRTAARLKLAEFRAAGITLRLDGSTLRVGPAANVVNGLAQELATWRERLIEVLRESGRGTVPAKQTDA